ncbi:MAG TPA: polysaccharide deacetylase family protein [Planctomycetota bacterium]|nr:polysaccharide deacetylase family protein [Planctomycetota bacterium]
MTTSAFAWPGGARAAVSITFDDGRPSQARGAEILAAHGLRGTFFVLMRQVAAAPEAWQAMARAGHEIGNHTRTHPCSGNFAWSRPTALEDWTIERIAEDIDAASAEIAACFGARPRSFAYCCGQSFVGRGAGRRSYVPVVAERFLVGRGFRDEHPNDPAFVDLAHVGGVDLDGLQADAIARLVDAAARDGAWLALAGHEVDERPGQSVDPRALDAACRALRARGDIWVAPLGEVAAYVAQRRGR